MTLLIHPGFHKTATTWLQQAVFGDARHFHSLFSHEEISDLLLQPYDHAFDPTAVRAEIEQRMQRSPEGVANVISSEILSGNIMYGSRERAWAADRIAALRLPGRVLLTVRAQLPIANSIYKQYVKRGGRLTLHDFLTHKPEPGYFWFHPETLEFDRLAARYAGIFGAENVLVLPQELLKTDRRAYLGLLFEFAGLDPERAEGELQSAAAAGVSPPASGLGIIRFANTFRRSVFNPSAPSPMNALGHALQSVGYRWKWGEDAQEARLRDQLAQVMGGRYAQSNARLQQFSPVDLAACGYEMADQHDPSGGISSAGPGPGGDTRIPQSADIPRTDRSG